MLKVFCRYFLNGSVFPPFPTAPQRERYVAGVVAQSLSRTSGMGDCACCKVDSKLSCSHEAFTWPIAKE